MELIIEMHYSDDSDSSSNVWQFLPTPPSDSLTSAAYPTIQLNADTIYPDTVSESTG